MFVSNSFSSHLHESNPSHKSVTNDRWLSYRDDDGCSSRIRTALPSVKYQPDVLPWNIVIVLLKHRWELFPARTAIIEAVELCGVLFNSSMVLTAYLRGPCSTARARN